jgi:hypothetical protein
MHTQLMIGQRQLTILQCSAIINILRGVQQGSKDRRAPIREPVCYTDLVSHFEALNPWLFSCLRDTPPPEHRPDIPSLIAAVKKNRLALFFHRWLLRYSADPYAGEILMTMKSDLLFIQRSALMKLSATKELLEQCNRDGIKTILLKGIGLSQILYGDPCQRMSVDVDIMIDRNQIFEIHQLLLAKGYQTDVKTDLLKTRRERILRRYKDLIYVHPTFGFSIEIHWRLESNARFFQVSFEQLWESRSTVNINSFSVACLGDIDNLIYLSLHGAKHYWKRLQRLTDIKDLIQSRTWDWNEVISRATKYNALYPLLITEELISSIYGDLIPQLQESAHNQRLIRCLTKHCLRNLFSDPDEVTIDRQLWNFYLISSLAPQIHYKFSFLSLFLSGGYSAAFKGQSGELSHLSYFRAPFRQLFSLLKRKRRRRV